MTSPDVLHCTQWLTDAAGCGQETIEASMSRMNVYDLARLAKLSRRVLASQGLDFSIEEGT